MLNLGVDVFYLSFCLFQSFNLSTQSWSRVYLSISELIYKLRVYKTDKNSDSVFVSELCQCEDLPSGTVFLLVNL